MSNEALIIPILIPEAQTTEPSGVGAGSGGAGSPNSGDPLHQHSDKAQYQDLFLRSMDGILLVDISTANILEVNDSAAKIFRLEHENLNGKSLYNFTTPDFLPEFRKMVRIASRRYNPKSFEIPLIVGGANNGPRVLIAGEVAMSPLKLRDETEVLQVIVRDITEKKIAEKKIAEYVKQVEIANKKLEELATTDGMTGLTNFRQFSNLLEKEHSRSARHAAKYAIVFMDIDHFKKFNDQNGHPAGDALLKEFAKIIRKAARDTDVVARYGGEEFVVLAPETDTEQAFILAERIRTAVCTNKFLHGEKQPMGFVSCSIGVSSFPLDGTDAKSVLQAADDVLYLSKHGGRNKVTLSKGVGKNPPIPKGPK